MDWFPGAIALTTLAAAIALVLKGWDVRAVLLAAAFVTATGSDLIARFATGAVPAVVRALLATFSEEKFVVPICSAMGFAYVLKHTGCQRHFVSLMVKPLRGVRGLLVPGVVVVGFLVNVPLISQTSTAVCLGAVVVPLMSAAGYSMATTGACLLLGASVGGELLNPGAPELLTVFKETGVSTAEQATRYLPPLVFVQLAIATVVVWILSFRWERGPRAAPTEGCPDPAPERIDILKALVPLVPLALLLATGLPDDYKLFDVPDEWVMAVRPDGTRDPAYRTRLIGLAMLTGVLVAIVAAPDKSRGCVHEFFTGAGYGFANVVSLIVAATCYGKAIEAAGVARALGDLIREVPGLLHPLSCYVPLAFAALCGSGMASTQSLYSFFHAPAVALGQDPVSVGALVSLGSAAGRTMSPVSAVVLMCGTLTGTNPFVLVKRVAGPLLVGVTVVVLLRVAGRL